MGIKKAAFVVVVVVLLAVAGVLTYIKSSKSPKELTFSTGVKIAMPVNWNVLKKPLRDQVILKNSSKDKDNSCYVDIFTVRPDKDYSFKQWLETALTNQVFLAGGRETTYKDRSIFMGSYDFYNDQFNETVRNQRAILKDRGVFFDIKLSYKNNDCSKDFFQILDSVTF